MLQASQISYSHRFVGWTKGDDRNGRRRDTEGNTHFHTENAQTRDKKSVQGVSKVSAAQERSGAQTLYPAVTQRRGTMAKDQKPGKNDKTKATKTMKEKKLAKREKKEGKGGGLNLADK